MSGSRDRTRGVTPVIGNILLIAVVVVIGMVLATMSLTFLEKTGSPQADAAFEFEQTPVGLELTPKALGTDVKIQLSGTEIASLEAGSAGESVLLPTAPGDTVTVISTEDEKSVLVREEIDERSEIGDFIGYYTFESGSGSTLKDQSGNGNDGEIKGSPDWISGSEDGLRFDGSPDHVFIEDISAPVDVDEFTIVVAYKQTGDQGSVNQLIEHQYGSGEEWFLETSHASGESYTNSYSVDFAVEYSNSVVASDQVSMNTRHVVAGTYDGSQYELYVDGTLFKSGTHSEAVEMGDMRIARDFESSSQYFDGEIYEVRLYYQAFGSDEIKRITLAMS
jgi:flagellin-like protein